MNSLSDIASLYHRVQSLFQNVTSGAYDVQEEIQANCQMHQWIVELEEKVYRWEMTQGSSKTKFRPARSRHRREENDCQFRKMKNQIMSSVDEMRMWMNHSSYLKHNEEQLKDQVLRDGAETMEMSCSPCWNLSVLDNCIRDTQEAVHKERTLDLLKIEEDMANCTEILGDLAKLVEEHSNPLDCIEKNSKKSNKNIAAATDNLCKSKKRRGTKLVKNCSVL